MRLLMQTYVVAVLDRKLGDVCMGVQACFVMLRTWMWMMLWILSRQLHLDLHQVECHVVKSQWKFMWLTCVLFLCMQVLMVLLHTAVAYWMLCRVVNTKASTLLSKQQQAYMWGFAPLEMYCAAVHPLLFASKLPFLPLLLPSVYSALGISFCWLQMAGCWLPSLSTHANVQKLL